MIPAETAAEEAGSYTGTLFPGLPAACKAFLWPGWQIPCDKGYRPLIWPENSGKWPPYPSCH